MRIAIDRNGDSKMTLQDETKKINKRLAPYYGSYVYYIHEKKIKLVVKVGESGNFVDRNDSHFHRGTLDGTLAKWCKENRKDILNYEMFVLDLTQYQELDKDDRLLIERALSFYHQDTVFNKDVPLTLNAYEIERLEYIYSIVDFNFVPYADLKERYKQERYLKKGNKKVLSLPTKGLER